MDPPPAMEKKAVVKVPPLPSKTGAEGPVKEYVGKKSAPQYSRKREYERPEQGKKSVAGRGGRAGQRYVRPREKASGQVEDGGAESGSLYRMGGKKQNITHLMNWWAPTPRSQGAHGHHRNNARVRRYSSHTPKFSKEHYLQANCQFVVRTGEDYSVYSADPDLLVEWKLVEEVRLHVSEAPACPICLHPPSAAKVTRCGHIYCYPCILHYLALSDDKWRHCPICYVPIGKEELRSVRAVCHKDFSIGEEIELQLMRRERESILPMPSASYCPNVVREPQHISSPNAASPFAKLLLASKEEVCTQILQREERDLIAQLLEEGDQPEACFIDEALSLIQARQKALMEKNTKKGKDDYLEAGMQSLSLSSPEDEHSTTSASSESFSDEPITPTSPVDVEQLPPMEPTPPNLPQPMDDKEKTSSVTAEDLDISQLQPGNHNPGPTPKNAPKANFYFYQASNGAHIYLHSLNTKMLVHEYGDLVNCPAVFKGKIVEKESVTMTEELRQRLRYLSHLPVASSFDVIEVVLKEPLVSKLTFANYQDKIEARQHQRNKRAREERKIEKRVQAEQDRMLGRSRGAANLRVHSHVHFPSFAEDLPNVPARDSNEGAVPIPVSNTGGEGVASSPGDSLYGSSTDTTGSGVSFAKMIREGQSKVHPSPSESVVQGGNAWPTLGGKTAWPAPTVLSKNNGKPQANPWGARSNTGAATPRDDVDDDEDEVVPVPEFKHAFSDAIAKAFDRAALNTIGNDEPERPEPTNNGGKKGKKKKKKVVLFSSGGLS